MMKWPTHKLEEIAAVIMGQSPEGSSYNREGNGTPLLNGPTEFGPRHPVAVQWTTMPTKLTENGDILFCVRGNTLGRMNIADGAYCIGRGLAAIRAKAGTSNQDFITFQLRHLAAEFMKRSAGSTFPNLPGSELNAFKVLVPPLQTQHRIAAELDEQLSAIDEARVAAAEAMEAALFREFFHGLSPVMIGLPKDAAPAGWKWTRLLGLADLESGHTPSRKHPEWWGGDIPWLALPDIRALDGKVAMETKERTNPLGIANSSARILPKDTVALSRTASVGFVTIFGRPMATSQDFVNWICGKELSPCFLMHALRASREHFLANASGAIHKTIYMPAVKDFHLCHPPRKQQDSLAAALDHRLADAATLLTAARAELAAIQALSAAALRRVFAV